MEADESSNYLLNFDMGFSLKKKRKNHKSCTQGTGSG